MTKLTKKIRKGFTLVELLVVIAILAILAAVSVVGYLSFTDKAKESNDISLTAQMNTVLEANEVLEGKAKTMSEALTVLEENGLVVEKLTPTSKGYSYVYDVAEGRMLLLDENYKVVAPAGASDANTYDTYVVADPKTKNVTELVNKGYGVYLPSNYVVDNNSLTINKAVNVDTGALELDNLEVKDENSTNAVVVNTMADNVTLTVPNGSVDLYGEQTKVSSSTASNSLHVYGKVLQLELVKGKVVAMTNAVINTVDTTVADAGATVEVRKDGGTIGAVITEEGATNVTVDSSLNDVVYTDTDIVTGFAGGVGTQESPFLIENGEQFANINTLYSAKTGEGVVYLGESYYFLQISDVELTSGTAACNAFTGVYDGGGYQLSYSQSVTTSSCYYFFNIAFNNTIIKNLNIYVRANQPMCLIYTSDWEVDTLNLRVENVSINSNGETVLANTGNFGFFGCYTTYNFSNIEYVNCTINASLNNQGASTGAFVGSGYWFIENFNEDSKIKYINCIVNGDIYGAQNVGLLYGNAAYVSKDQSKERLEYKAGFFEIENVRSNGIIALTGTSGYVGLTPGYEEFNEQYQNLCGGTYIVANYFTGKTVNLRQEGTNYYVNISDSDVDFKVAFNINVLDNEDGTVSNTTKFFYAVNYDSSINENEIMNHMALDLQKAEELFGDNIIENLSYDENGIAKYIDGDTIYFIFRDYSIGRNNTDYATPGQCSISIHIYAYNSKNQTVGTIRIK